MPFFFSLFCDLHSWCQFQIIQFLAVKVEGSAGKFSLKNTILNVGNGLALLGITTVICEFVLMNFIEVCC